MDERLRLSPAAVEKTIVRLRKEYPTADVGGHNGPPHRSVASRSSTTRSAGRRKVKHPRGHALL
jgi:hypothetical protein